MQLHEMAAVTAGVLALAAPGLLLARAWLPDHPPSVRLSLGLTLGLGLMIGPGTLVIDALGLTSARWLLAGLYVAGIAAVIIARGSAVSVGSRRLELSLAALAALVFVSRLVPALYSTLPIGTDPTFHLVLVKKILLEGGLARDWLPFEALGVHYTQGTHALAAMLTLASGASPHAVFQGLFPILAAASTLLVGGVSRQVFGDDRSAFWAAAVYGLLPIWGSLDYYRWGGLPTVLGMTLMLGIVCLLLTSGPGRRLRVLLIAALLVALTGSHNHSTLITLLVIGAWIANAAVVWRGDDEALRQAVPALLLSLPPALLLNRGSLSAVSGDGHTSLFRFYEHLLPLWDVAAYMGYAFTALAAASTWALARAARTRAQLFLLVWISALFVTFVALEYLYRYGALALTGEFYTALTPSRFVTVMAYPLAIACGFGVANALAWLEARRSLPWGALALTLAVALGAHQLRGQCVSADVDLEALVWLGENTPEDALIVGNHPWSSYVSWREGTHTKLPSSEDRNHPSIAFKQERLVQLGGIAEWTANTGRPVFLGQPAPMDEGQGFTLVHKTEQTYLYAWTGIPRAP